MLTNQNNEDNLFIPALIGLAYFDSMAHQDQHDDESIESTVLAHMIPSLLINRSNSNSDKEFSISNSSLGSNSASSMPILKSDHDICISEELDNNISILEVFDYLQYDEIYYNAMDSNDNCSFY